MKSSRLTLAIVPDSFKGALSAADVAAAMADGLKAALPGARFRLIPMADGGEGTVVAWAAATGARLCRAKTPTRLRCDRLVSIIRLLRRGHGRRRLRNG